MDPILSSRPPPRSLVNCRRHPGEKFTGFCPSCLCERLSSLDNSSSSSSLPPIVPRSSTLDAPIRRTKSFSVSKNESLGLTFVPQRKSCDVRGRDGNVSTLLSLFTLNDESGDLGSCCNENFCNIGSGFGDPVDVASGHDCENGEMRGSVDTHLEKLASSVETDVNGGEIVEDPAGKRSSRGGIWAAASIFTEKLQKWGRIQKTKKQSNFQPEKPISRGHIETQFEIADFPFKRRSCDMDLRLALEAPRASWDGYIIRRNSHRMPAECDTAESVPGGSAQTREYYADSSSHRRKKVLERSNSVRKSQVSEIDETKKSNARVSPTSADYFHGAKESRDGVKGPRKWWSWRLLGLGNKELESPTTENGVNRTKTSNNTARLLHKRDAKRSLRHSHPYPHCEIDSGLLRFYLAPMTHSRRGGTGRR